MTTNSEGVGAQPGSSTPTTNAEGGVSFDSIETPEGTLWRVLRSDGLVLDSGEHGFQTPGTVQGNGYCFVCREWAEKHFSRWRAKAPEVGSGGAGDYNIIAEMKNAMATPEPAAVADWRRTECVIEEDPRLSKDAPDYEYRFRIRHVPSGLVWGTGGFQTIETEDTAGYYLRSTSADKIVLSLVENDRPKAPNTEAAQPDHCEMPVVKLGQGAYETQIMPADLGVGSERFGCTIETYGEHFVVRAPTGKYLALWTEGVATWDDERFTYDSPARCRDVLGMATDPRPAPPKTEPAAVRPVTAPEQAEFDATLDAFGIGNPTKPPEGRGAPAAPCPLVFLDAEGQEIHAGSLVSPILDLSQVLIVGDNASGGFDLTTAGALYVVRNLSRDAAAKYWVLAKPAAPAARAAPEVRSPVNIAQLALLELEAWNHEQRRRRVSDLVLELLHRCV